VKLYFCSSESDFYVVEAKLTMAKVVTGGILIATIMLWGAIKLNQSWGNASGSHRAAALVAENDILRQHLSSMAPRVKELEMQAGKLHERFSLIHLILCRRIAAGNMVSGFTHAPRGFKPAEAGIEPGARQCELDSPGHDGQSFLQVHNTLSQPKKLGTVESMALALE